MKRSVLAIACFLLLGVSLPAHAEKLCPGLSGQARTQCLKAEQARNQKDLDRINRDNRRLDLAIGATKGAKELGGIAAGGAAGIATSPFGPAASIAAGAAAEKAYGAGTDRIANGKPCKPSGQSGNAKSTAQRC